MLTCLITVTMFIMLIKRAHYLYYFIVFRVRSSVETTTNRYSYIIPFYLDRIHDDDNNYENVLLYLYYNNYAFTKRIIYVLNRSVVVIIIKILYVLCNARVFSLIKNNKTLHNEFVVLDRLGITVLAIK